MTSILILAAALSGPPPANAAKPPSTYFRGVFTHRERVRSIQIGYWRLPKEADARVEGIGIRVEEGCFTYEASGYIRGNRMVLLPVSNDLGHDTPDAEIEPEILKHWRDLGLLVDGRIAFDMASLICHLNERREIESVEIVLPDLTIYHVKRDHKTRTGKRPS